MARKLKTLKHKELAKPLNSLTKTTLKMEKYTPSHIANYFLWRAWEEGVKDMTMQKLIKLVYIAYGWNLVMNNNQPKLFEEPILAWKYGPVISSIYYEFRKFGNKPIIKGGYSAIFGGYGSSDFGDDLESVPTIDENDTIAIKILNAEWNNYINYDDVELRVIANTIWQNALKQGLNTRLDDSEIKEFFTAELTKLIKKNENNPN